MWACHVGRGHPSQQQTTATAHPASVAVPVLLPQSSIVARPGHSPERSAPFECNGGRRRRPTLRQRLCRSGGPVLHTRAAGLTASVLVEPRVACRAMAAGIPSAPAGHRQGAHRRHTRNKGPPHHRSVAWLRPRSHDLRGTRRLFGAQLAPSRRPLGALVAPAHTSVLVSLHTPPTGGSPPL